MRVVKAVGPTDVAVNPLQNGSWSRMLLTRDQVTENQACLGVSLFTPGTVSTAISHEAEELIYVTRGRGELRTDGEPVPFAPGDALFVPPGVWHWVANTGDEDVEMVFSFPTPQYPETARR